MFLKGVKEQMCMWERVCMCVILLLEGGIRSVKRHEHKVRERLSSTAMTSQFGYNHVSSNGKNQVCLKPNLDKG